ncbi:hypothetical protein RDI58_027701 [Solanum bulbocastanum]|uniref:Uncharacterized protein n=1 Tax=Solanum bulbocastanum TaxID=147425 RepID=A0AAN8SY78_SOLBU
MGDVCRYAVVTGANKGIGFETVKQLAKSGVTVVLTARNEKRGMEATSLLNGQGFSNVVFHQLDVQDAQSIESLAKFLQTQYGRLDILVNNAGASGVVVDEDVLRALNVDPEDWLAGKVFNVIQVAMKTTYESAKLCLDTNYYGVKNVTEALLPLLQNSPSARIVNVSSLRSELKNFLHDLKQDALEVNGWQMMLPAYSISKVSLNAYTRILARKYPKMCINCVHPGYVNTDINWRTGTMPVEEGAEGPYAVVTGANKGIGFEIVKQLANSDVMVVLTARNEKRGMEAMYLLNEQGFLNVVFHQLDVQDAQSIESLAKFIQTPYGRLDILVRA